MVRNVTSQERLGRNVRAARLAAGLTSEMLAFRAGVSVRTVTRLERAEHSARPETLSAVANVLRTTPALLLAETAA